MPPWPSKPSGTAQKQCSCPLQIRQRQSIDTEQLHMMHGENASAVDISLTVHHRFCGFKINRAMKKKATTIVRKLSHL
jgi:hypothetical protein